uniref:Uncharacterized protein n=1 Tax=Cucumis sativus TaxID=3659 RepID=A0A0A0KFZ3_CUCSA
MATPTTRTWVFPKSSYREITCFDFESVGVGRGYRKNLRRWTTIKGPMCCESGKRKLNMGLSAGKVCNREEVKTTAEGPEIETKNDAYYTKVTEEDRRFIEEFREAYPYIFSHIGRTFVVVISAEIVASPRLHALLKVSLSLVSVIKIASF